MVVFLCCVEEEVLNQGHYSFKYSTGNKPSLRSYQTAKFRGLSSLKTQLFYLARARPVCSFENSNHEFPSPLVILQHGFDNIKSGIVIVNTGIHNILKTCDTFLAK